MQPRSPLGRMLALHVMFVQGLLVRWSSRWKATAEVPVDVKLAILAAFEERVNSPLDPTVLAGCPGLAGLSSLRCILES